MLNNDEPGIQTPHYLGENHHQPFGYHVYLPPDYHEAGEGFPLLVFLHGVGERGDSSKNPIVLNNVLRNGPPRLIANSKWPSQTGMIVVSPQCHETRWFPHQIHQLFEFVFAHYHVDKKAVYLTGLSMGGFGAFHYLEQYASENKIAAAVVVCGGGDVSDVESLKNIPIWAFHGEADNVVPSIYSMTIVNAINEANPTVKAKITIYPTIEHDSWTMTYDGTGMGKESKKYDPFDENIYSWMLKYRT